MEFADWDANSPSAKDNKTACAQMIELIHSEDHEIYIAEYTDLGALFLTIFSTHPSVGAL